MAGVCKEQFRTRLVLAFLRPVVKKKEKSHEKKNVRNVCQLVGRFSVLKNGDRVKGGKDNVHHGCPRFHYLNIDAIARYWDNLGFEKPRASVALIRGLRFVCRLASHAVAPTRGAKIDTEFGRLFLVTLATRFLRCL